jgi:hypothetical protein
MLTTITTGITIEIGTMTGTVTDTAITTTTDTTTTIDSACRRNRSVAFGGVGVEIQHAGLSAPLADTYSRIDPGACHEIIPMDEAFISLGNIPRFCPESCRKL